MTSSSLDDARDDPEHRRRVVVMPGPPLTTDQYFLMPETVLPQELVWGRVRDAPAPMPGHQWAVGQFFITLTEHVE